MPGDKEDPIVFLSYSRKDEAFCHGLASALEERGHTPVFDQSQRSYVQPDLRLTAQDEWWSGIKRMITASDVMILVITPDSIASAVCGTEIAFARSLGKRIIPILRRDIDLLSAPARVRALNIQLDFRDDHPPAVEASLAKLTQEIETDIGWHRLGAKFSRDAAHWEAGGRPVGRLLSRTELVEYEAWCTARPLRASDQAWVVLEDLVEASRNELAVEYLLSEMQAREEKNLVGELRRLKALESSVVVDWERAKEKDRLFTIAWLVGLTGIFGVTQGTLFALIGLALIFVALWYSARAIGT